jgi:hypothetical protein
MERKNYRMPIFHLLETEAKMLGMQMSSFYNFDVAVMLTYFVPQLIEGFGLEVGWMFYMIAFFALVFFYFFLRSMGKKGYPNFLMAWLSYTLMQPERISSMKFQLNLKTLKEIKNENRGTE